MSGTFGCLQKTAFVGLVIGSLLCLVGIVGPEWIMITYNYGDISRIGLWTINRDYLDAVKGCSITCLVLCGTCTIVAFGMVCRCQGASTFYIGVITFTSGLFGFIAIGAFAAVFEDRDNYSYGWAFALFLTGTIILTFASFAAIFGTPKVPRVQVTPVTTIYRAANVTRVTAQLPLITPRPKNVQPLVVATGPVNVQPAVVATKPLAPGMYWGQNGEGPYYQQYNNCVFAERIIMIHNPPK